MKITFRATFQQPIGSLNTLGVRLPMPMDVEIYQSGKGQWKAREPRLKNEYKLPYQISANTMKQMVQSSFEKQLKPWAMFDGDSRELTPEMIEVAADGNVSRKTLTHITAKTQGPEPLGNGKGASFTTACGEVVIPKWLVSKRGEVRPSCPTCKEIFEREYVKSKPA